jgi:hypothetical protein
MKTAAGWLIEQTEKLITIETFQQWKELKEQAIEMEKEQIIEAFNSGQAKEASECFWTKGNFYYENKYGQHTDSNL